MAHPQSVTLAAAKEDEVISSVKFEAYYSRSTDVPRIGQRKWMLVNGAKQLMTLNHIEANRRRVMEFDENELRDKPVVEFSTTEIWGEYF